MKKTNKQTNNNKNRISTSPFISAFFLFIYWYKLSFMFLVQKEKKVEVEVAWTKVCVNLYGSSVCLGVASLGSVSCCVLSFA